MRIKTGMVGWDHNMGGCLNIQSKVDGYYSIWNGMDVLNKSVGIL
jgi:hypothetical protein